MDRRHEKYLKNLLGAIKFRCSNPNQRYYQRGVRCYLTQENIDFLWNRDKGWLLKEPSIDRIDNNGNYILENCRYLELVENGRLGGFLTPNKKKIGMYSMDEKHLRDFDSLEDAKIYCGKLNSRYKSSHLSTQLTESRRAGREYAKAWGYKWKYYPIGKTA